MTINEFTFASSTGVNDIRAKQWLPEGRPRAVIQLTHGLCGYMELQEHTAEWFCGRGFAVVASDALGHGPLAQKSGDLGYFADSKGWFRVVDDFGKLYDMTRAEFPETPYFLLGNSMGSFIVRSFLILRPESIAGAVLAATSMNSEENLEGGRRIALENMERKGGPRGTTGKLLAYCFGSYNKRFRPVKTVLDWMTRDEERIKEKLNDPLTQFYFSIGLYLDMAEGQLFNMRPENLEKMRAETPVLFVSGAEDAAGDFGKGVVSAFESFERAGMKDLEIKLYEGARHDILDDLNREEVHSDILRWCEQRM